MMIKSFQIFGYKTLLLLFVLFFDEVFPKDNKLFWDGRDWNRVKKTADYNSNY